MQIAIQGYFHESSTSVFPLVSTPAAGNMPCLVRHPTQIANSNSSSTRHAFSLDTAELDVINREHRKITAAMSTVADLRREICASHQYILELTPEEAEELGLNDFMSDRTAE